VPHAPSERLRTDKLRVLASVLACRKDHGSEASIGYRYLEFLAQKYDVTALAAPPCTAPAGVRLVEARAGFCDINDVFALPLMRFELNQLRIASTKRLGRIDIVHRVTPAAISIPSLLPLLKRPLIIGPLIAAPTPPASFDPILKSSPRMISPQQWRPSRIPKGIANRASDYLRDTQFAINRASLILVGMREAWRQIPQHLQDRCVSMTWSGIDHHYFVPPDARPSAQPFKLLFVGRLVPYKGVELLLRAVHLARPRCRLELAIIGSGEERHEQFLRKLSDDLGLGQVVQFRSSVPRAELVKHYQAADVLCFPTLADTYGITLLEAMSCGCAVLASNTGGPAELVNDECGIKIRLSTPSQYVSEFADALVALASNVDLRRRLGASARRYVVQNHDWASVGRQLLDIYEEFVKRAFRKHALETSASPIA
jgi:glycosyltransferase involved in cell wall biosynthesis